MRDEEWGFFVDLEVDNEKITIKTIKKKNNNLNYLNTIYEEDYWYEREDFHHEYEGEYEIKKKHNQEDNDNNNNKEKEKYNKSTIATIIIYCIFCASVISLSLTLV
uniref:Uncharacterized protein n=1 Tax=viral metagenome TaxID=1070528 RepID=A0A6C0DV57_9ZZZZ